MSTKQSKFPVVFRDGPLDGQERMVDGRPVHVRDVDRTGPDGFYEGKYVMDEHGEYRFQGYKLFRVVE